MWRRRAVRWSAAGVGAAGGVVGRRPGPRRRRRKMGNETGYKLSPEEIECLQDRKWWCFLLSSIFTFLAGLLIVLLWRAFAIICCRSEESPEYSQSDLKQGPRPPRREQEDFESTFVTEAKDWAGELISGQTTTGRILVSLFHFMSSNFATTVSVFLLKLWLEAYFGSTHLSIYLSSPISTKLVSPFSSCPSLHQSRVIFSKTYE